MTPPNDSSEARQVSDAARSAALGARPVKGIILRNALFLVIAQAIVTPLSILVNAMMARYLGAPEFGNLYLAMTFASLGFLVVEWGQGALLTATVARDRPRAGELLASSLAWRTGASIVVAGGLAVIAARLGHDNEFGAVLLLVVLGSSMGTMVNACQDVVRGFERTDFGAASYVGWQVLRSVVVVPTLLFGGRLRAVLVAQAICGALGLLVVFAALRSVGIRGLAVRRSTVKELFKGGTPFLVFGLTIALQTNVDAVFLSRLASAEAVGWYAAASKLVGVLTYPASVLIAALYPTLCRLHAEDQGSFRRTAAGAMRTTAILVVPVALGCALYPDLGIRLFSRESFGPAEDDLRVLAIYLLLLYFSMPVGTCLVAAGRQRAWAATQATGVVVSAVLDPVLVARFQARTGNGGLGVCVATVVSEVLMVAGGIALMPRGVFDRKLGYKLLRGLAAGAAMAAVGRATVSLTSFASAPLAVAAYAASLWMLGGLDREDLDALRGLLRRRAAAA
jgi:O-antigen/teichoic acid export membrane protein